VTVNLDADGRVLAHSSTPEITRGSLVNIIRLISQGYARRFDNDYVTRCSFNLN